MLFFWNKSQTNTQKTGTESAKYRLKKYFKELENDASSTDFSVILYVFVFILVGLSSIHGKLV